MLLVVWKDVLEGDTAFGARRADCVWVRRREQTEGHSQSEEPEDLLFSPQVL